MFEKDMIAIDISNEVITILVGNKLKITSGTTIKTPKDAFDGDSVKNVQAIAEVIRGFLRTTKTKARDVLFSVRGEDIITRHMEIPMVQEDALLDSVEFELRQFMGDRLDEYYFDYEIVGSEKNAGSGKCHALIVAVEKSKIDSYMALGHELKLNVKGIDLYANAVARVIGNLKSSATKGIKTIGVIDIGVENSAIVITEWGKLVLDKYRSLEDMSMYDKTPLDSIDLTEVKEYDEQTEMERSLRDEINEYNSLIQYYTSGKVRKNLDRIYVIGSASNIRGIEQYVSVNLNSRVAKAPTFSELRNSVKNAKSIYLKDYMVAYGLLLRRE